jgi:hypothetical protein
VGGGLLDLLAVDVDVPMGVGVCIHLSATRSLPGRKRTKLTCVWNVEASLVLANLLHSRDGLVVQLNLLEVGLDARGSDGLGDDAVATDLGPGENDLGTSDGLAKLLGETLGRGDDVGVGDEEGLADAVVSKGRVGGDVDVLLLAVLDVFFLLEAGVSLDLVDGGNNARVGDNGIELAGER